MTETNSLELVGIYLFISDLYDNELFAYCQRFSNNYRPAFTDSELISVYMYVSCVEGLFTLKKIHSFACRHLRSWFPLLPSYEAFVNRLNRLCSVFPRIVEHLCQRKIESCDHFKYSVLDSMPIITCSGKRKPKVATDIVDKSYCASKDMFYHGLKLHLLAFARNKALPLPESIIISAASEHDLNVFKQNWDRIENRSFVADKAYKDQAFFEHLYQKNKSSMITPIKEVKGMVLPLKQRDKAYNDLFSKAVSSIRQPVESFFNWLIEHTKIQTASKVRSEKGLIIHIFARLTSALWIF